MLNLPASASNKVTVTFVEDMLEFSATTADEPMLRGVADWLLSYGVAPIDTPVEEEDFEVEFCTETEGLLTFLIVDEDYPELLADLLANILADGPKNFALEIQR